MKYGKILQMNKLIFFCLEDNVGIDYFFWCNTVKIILKNLNEYFFINFKY